MFSIVVLLTCIYPYIVSAIYAEGPYGAYENCLSPEYIGDLVVDGQKVHLEKILAGGTSACVYTTDLKYDGQEAVAKCYKRGQEDAMEKEKWALEKMDNIDREQRISTPPRYFGSTGYFSKGEVRTCLIETRLHGVPFEETEEWNSIIGRGREYIAIRGDLRNKQCVDWFEQSYDRIADATLKLAKTYGIWNLDTQMQNVYWREGQAILFDFGLSKEVVAYTPEAFNRSQKPKGETDQMMIRDMAYNSARRFMPWASDPETGREGRCRVTEDEYLDLYIEHA